MTPLFWPTIGIFIVILGVIMFFAGAPNAYSITAIVLGGGLTVGSVLALFAPKRK